MVDEQQEGGLIIPQGKDRHEFRAPAPRTSLLGIICSPPSYLHFSTMKNAQIYPRASFLN
jgi:hypothetical protein